jgi:hypothetical protein
VATPNAVRRGGSLLLRTLAVGGFAAAAWFVCAGVASAGEDDSDEAAKTLDAVNVAHGEQQTAVADLLAGAVPHDVAAFQTVAVAPQPFEPPSFGGVELFAVESRPLVFLFDQAGLEATRYHDPYATTDSSSDTGGYSYSSGSTGDHSSGYSAGYSHSGGVSNTMPAPLYEAKVAEKAAVRAAAARAAAVRAQEPAPVVPVAAPARGNALVASSTPPPPDLSKVTPNTEVLWEAPKPSAPAPTPKQAPAPSAPTASSGGADSGGGGHRGGVLASLTGQSDLKPLAAWSAERWDDDRSPGSVPGLPSTSPD